MKKCGYCHKQIESEESGWGICGDCGDQLTRLDSMPPEEHKPVTGSELSKTIIALTLLALFVTSCFFLMVFGAIALYQKYHHV
jgi:hypothetical protein